MGYVRVLVCGFGTSSAQFSRMKQEATPGMGSFVSFTDA